MKLSTHIIILALLALSLYLAFFRPQKTVEIIQQNTDTFYCHDTIKIVNPKPLARTKEKLIIRYDTIRLRDTVILPLPIHQKEYKTADYKALIEGYNPSLVYLELYPKKEIITQKITTPPPRISHGVNLGMGLLYGFKGLDLGFYAGYGFCIRF